MFLFLKARNQSSWIPMCRSNCEFCVLFHRTVEMGSRVGVFVDRAWLAVAVVVVVCFGGSVLCL